MTYHDIVRAEQKRAARVSAKVPRRGGRYPRGSKPGEGQRWRADELEVGKREIEASGLEKYLFHFAISYCSILQFQVGESF